MPESTEERVEKDVVYLILRVVEWKKRNDRPGARWKVGTTRDANDRLGRLSNPQIGMAVSSWERGSPQRAAQEIAEYHGMEIDGTTGEEDTEIYAYTDRPPTTGERKKREREPLTIAQKRVFRAIKEYVEYFGRGPTKMDVTRISGHRTTTTKKGVLDILERKNWIVVGEGRQRIELI